MLCQKLQHEQFSIREIPLYFLTVKGEEPKEPAFVNNGDI